MGWGKKQERLGDAGASRSSGDLNAAAALSAAQLPAVAALVWVQSFSRDDYGVGIGGAPAAVGFLCMLLFAPLILPFLGLVQAAVLTLPSVCLARGLPGPGPLRHLLAPLVPAACWGLLTALLWHWPLTTTVPVLTALGLLPTLGVPYVRRRAWRWWGPWWRAAIGSAVLFVLALGGGIAASVTGLIPQYEPPELTPAQLVGVWRGDHGAELRLGSDGRATARRLPTEPADSDWAAPDYEDFVVCAGSGTWEPDADPPDAGRPGIVLHLGTDCGLDTRWSFSGTEADPKLFVLFGDPDAGTLRTLDRAGD
ncbi:hypothetical protein SRB17_60130 [Streptomyces sp. RB17]|uniref:hypothetical protein n=1 Tax=Streptomyces sp. RB17 TaxID=2585197 RepID=UPI001296FDB1|nr:hypothetical protein [Streptomyces sp. RB17]MQY38005.1 hypothetical protein [Streptomyces sp. RB17]